MMRPARMLASAGAILTALVADPRAVQACAVCFGGKDSDWNGAFLLGTALMLVLPPAIIVSAGIAIYRGIKRQEARQRERDAHEATGVHHGARPQPSSSPS